MVSVIRKKKIVLSNTSLIWVKGGIWQSFKILVNNLAFFLTWFSLFMVLKYFGPGETVMHKGPFYDELSTLK